ncbi:TetR/AcrR family transcriptional regulator C-terminal domain-containing protein [Streptomyces sp. NPDC059447]|uniref:TetR/AcrR family transcriptional regulator C-terminal domain-containing protein n=1 Tax=Streptomyces sp. NPDC059447 TaxID=3346834 RepID=UPI0036B4E458
MLNWADAAWDFYLAHPWMLRVATTGAPTSPNEPACFEALLRPLAQSGLAAENLVATAMFISSAVRDLARIATEIVPSGSDHRRARADWRGPSPSSGRAAALSSPSPRWARRWSPAPR